MSTSPPYSADFQRFLQLVESALAQAAQDARELAERTGTPLDVREVPGSIASGPAVSNLAPSLNTFEDQENQPAGAGRDPE